MSPRDGSNIYSQPDPDVVADTTIESAKYNNFTNDIAQDLNLPRPIVAGGTGATNARDAMIALSGDVARQNVTNYNSHPFVSGSFYSVGGATGEPVSGLAFAGVCYVYDADPTFMTLIGHVQNDAASPGRKYVRQKTTIGWSAWTLQPGSIADLENTYVNVGGDVMTGNLTAPSLIVSATTPSVDLVLNKTVATIANNIWGKKSSLNRWALQLGDNTNESGSNVGSDFVIQRYTDGGAYVNDMMKITRSTGRTTFDGPVSINNFISAVGHEGRAGTAGSYAGNYFNLFYNAGPLQAWIDTTNLGNITITSDYRVKKDVTGLPSMWDVVKSLRPIKYTQAEFTPPSAREASQKSGKPFFVADNVEQWGFIAHELQETLTPSAATGVKDAPDTIQSPNPFTLIAALTKALQEAMARIEALEVR